MSKALGIDIDLNKTAEVVIQNLIVGGHDFIQTFGAAVDSIVKNKRVQMVALVIAIVAAAVFTGGQAVAALVSTGWTAVAVGATAGAVAGGYVGAIGFGLFEFGTMAEGFAFGAAIGAVAGGLSGDNATVLKNFYLKHEKPIGMAFKFNSIYQFGNGDRTGSTMYSIFTLMTLIFTNVELPEPTDIFVK